MKRTVVLALLLCGGVVDAAERPAKPNGALLTDARGWQDVKGYDIGEPNLQPLETWPQRVRGASIKRTTGSFLGRSTFEIRIEEGMQLPQ